MVQDNFKFGDDKEIVRLSFISETYVRAVKVALYADVLSGRSWLCRTTFWH